MAPPSVERWAYEVEAALLRRHGGSLAWLFTPHRVTSIPRFEKELNKGKLVTPEEVLSLHPQHLTSVLTALSPSMSPDFRNSAVAYFKLLQAAISEDWVVVVRLGQDIVDCWINLLRDDIAWHCLTPALGSVCDFVVTAADLADESSQGMASDMIEVEDENMNFGSNVYLQEVLNGIRKHIGKFRGDETNQGAYMILLGGSIRVCLKLRNVQMAAAFLKTIPTNQPISPYAPRGPATRFRYYFGNLLLQRESFAQAEDPLVWSYTYCPAKQVALKRSIVACLVAVRLKLGFLPPRGFLESCNLGHYQEVVEAIRKGDLLKYHAAMSKHSDQFYEDGTTLCLQRVKYLVQRSLCERIYGWCLAHGKAGEQGNVVSLRFFTAGFKWQMDQLEKSRLGDEILEFDEEEMMCVMGSLIRQDYIRGYIAWQPRMLVVSKKIPFPPIYEGGRVQQQ